MRLEVPPEEFESYANGSDPLTASFVAVDAYVSLGDFEEAVDLGEKWQAIIEDTTATPEEKTERRRAILTQFYGLDRSDDE